MIQSPTLGSNTVIAGTGGTIQDVGVELAGTGSTGLFTSGAAIRVAVTAPPGTTSGVGATLLGATFENGSITLPAGPGINTIGAASFIVPDGTVQDSRVTASIGLEAIITAARDRIVANQGIREVNSGPAGGIDATFVVDDTAIETIPGPNPETGISATTTPPTSGIATLQLTVRHTSVMSSGAGGSTGAFRRRWR